jgi:cold-inducible RNA-binding protein
MSTGQRVKIIRTNFATFLILFTYFFKYQFKFITFTKKSRMKIFVAGLPYDLDDAELMEIFEKFGTITSAKVAIDKETGKSKGFAFVDMPNRDEAKDAIESLNDMSLGKKPLVVKEAEERSGPPGGSGGGMRRPNPGGGSGGGFNRDNRGGSNDRGAGGFNRDRR